MKYFVGTAVGKKTSTVLGNAPGTAQGGATLIFFFFHVVNDMLVLSLLIMHFFPPPCGKNVLDLTPVSCHGRISLRCLLLLL